MHYVGEIWGKIPSCMHSEWHFVFDRDKVQALFDDTWWAVNWPNLEANLVWTTRHYRLIGLNYVPCGLIILVYKSHQICTNLMGNEGRDTCMNVQAVGVPAACKIYCILLMLCSLQSMTLNWRRLNADEQLHNLAFSFITVQFTSPTAQNCAQLHAH